MKLKFSILLAFLLFFAVLPVLGQYVIKGRVTDAKNGDPIPFASVGLVGVSQGATTNFQGEFTLNSKYTADSLFASFVGYKKRVKKITRAAKLQEVDFQLEPTGREMAEVIVYSGENPAFKILRGVIKNREKNDRSKLSAYEYDSYAKMELDVDNISEKFKERKVMKDIAQAIKKFEKIAGEDGKLIIPTYISESVGKFYYLESPQRKKETIIKTNIKGVGVKDGSLISQLVGGNLVANYNFYQNFVGFFGKDFASPIGENWKG
jgi:CarboxypepD_reg-like domain